MIRNAIFSNDRKYRYLLERSWSNEENLLIMMLNPSNADEFKDDHTIKKCIKISRNFNFGGITVINLFGYITSSPNDLLNVNDNIGHDNDKYIFDTVSRFYKMLCAWGSSFNVQKRIYELKSIFCKLDLYCLYTNKDKSPRHPCRSRIPDKLSRFKIIDI